MAFLMSSRFFTVLIVFCVLSIGFLHAQTVPLPGAWLFMPGDSLQYAHPEYKDAGWSSIKVPAQWETQGFPNLDGFAWYRVHFTVPKNLLKKDLYLLPGKIDDADATYLNGVLIGSTGAFPPNAASEWNAQRIYKIPAGLLKQDNVLAVRVFDMGGPGGIQAGAFGLFDEKEYKKLFAVSDKPAKSFYNMVTSNGLIAGVYDEKNSTLASIFPHIFQSVDNNVPVKAFISDVRISISGKPVSVSYEKNTHIILAAYKNADVRYFASFTEYSKVFYIEVSGSKSEVAKASITFTKGSDAQILVDSVTVDNTSKSRKFYLISFNDALHNNNEVIKSAKENLLKHPDLSGREIAFMKNILHKAAVPANMNVKERNVFEQSVSFLKMAQVSQREIFPKSRGQILASLPPGIWNICWIRDATYSVQALTKLHLYDEARNALLFFLNAESNNYKSYVYKDNKEYGIGSDYQISVCRYFGNGKEESDFNEDGPNIELDGFGLFLSAMCNYVEKSGDTTLFQINFKTLKNRIAYPLLNSVAGNGLIRKESGSWERHLPGKQYAYTSITAAKGLKDFALLMKKLGHDGSEKYSTGSELLVQAIKKNLLINDSFIKGCAEAVSSKDHEYYDAASFEYFNFFPEGNEKTFALHFDEYKRNVGLADPRGFFRVNNGDWYDKQEWVFLDLRASLGLKKFSHPKEAKKLLNYVTIQSSLNNNMIAELYNEKTAGYEGAVPMVGFGAGSYILTLFGE